MLSVTRTGIKRALQFSSPQARTILAATSPFGAAARFPRLISNHQWRSYSMVARPSESLPINTGILFVPQQEAWVVERFGRFSRILEPGLAFLIPLIDRIRHVTILKEVAVEIPSQSAITEDNVTLQIDGVLYIRIVDPYKAAYGVDNPQYAVTQLAQTTMRAEIGKLTLDRTLSQRAELNRNIVEAINSASAEWGIRCLRYEIRDIYPPENVVEAMHSQVSAERQKRADILASEGQRQAAINVAEGQKQATILAAEAQKAEEINRAEGEAKAILMRSEATSEAIRRVADAIKHSPRGSDAVALSVADKYMDAFSKVAKEGTTILLPSNLSDPASMISQAMAVFNKVKGAESFNMSSKEYDFPLSDSDMKK